MGHKIKYLALLEYCAYFQNKKRKKELGFILVLMLFQFSYYSLFGQDTALELKKGRVAVYESKPKSTDELFVNGYVEGVNDNFRTYYFRENVPNGKIKFTVNINRFYSELMSNTDSQGFLTNAQELIARKLLPEKARLTLMVYDVDHDSQYDENEDGIAEPEIDHVFVNGRKITTDNDSAWTLGSGDSQWSSASIMIPIEYLKFPKNTGEMNKPSMAENIIEIEVDVNKTGHWAVACDWISIEIKNTIRPLLLVHGLWGDKTTWNTYSRFLTQDGVPYRVLDNVGYGCAYISRNSTVIEKEIATLRSLYGTDKVNLVVHSKGGLDARHYLRVNGGSQVENLVQLGTPNHGSEYAAIPFCDAVSNLSPYWIAENFNFFLTPGGEHYPLYSGEQNSGVPISVLVGKIDVINDGDGVVSRKRATLPWLATYSAILPIPGFAKDYTRPVTSVNQGAYFTGHSGLHERHDIYVHVVKDIISPNLVIRSTARMGEVESKQTIQKIEVDTDTLTIASIQKGTINASLIQRKSVFLASKGIIVFKVLLGDKLATVDIRSPSGKLYTTTSDEYNKNEIYENILVSYQITNNERGNWEIILKGGSKDGFYSAYTYVQSDKKIAYDHNNKLRFFVNEPISIRALFFQNNNPISNARLVAYLETRAKMDSLELFDDSRHGDGKAMDGIYGNQLPGIPEAGFVPITLKAQHGNEIIYKEAGLTILPLSAEFTSRYNEAVLDKDYDGYYDSLKIQVSFRVKQTGLYLISASLRDSKNTFITSASWSNSSGKPLEPGNYNISLNFSGIAIGKNGANGPFILDDLTLTDLAYGVPIAYLSKPYTTLKYTISDFPRPALELTDYRKETPIDLNGDGRFDFLDITVRVKVNFADYYSINGELIDSLQNSLNWAQKEAYLSEGINEITLRFDGEQINQKLTNGPYTLTNLFFLSESNWSSYGSTTFYDVYKTKAYPFSVFTGNMISGTVKGYASQQIVAGAIVLLRGAKLSTAISDVNGKFSIAGLPDGQYFIQATKNGYCNSDSISIILPNSQANYDLLIIEKVIPKITADQFLKLTSSSLFGNQWFLNDELIIGATEQTYQASKPGRYTVRVTIDNCSTISEPFEVVITSNEESQSVNLQLYPNPANDYLIARFLFNQKLDSIKYEIIDILGRKISERFMIMNLDGSWGSSIQLSLFPPGKYLFRVSGENFSIYKSFIKY